MNNATSSLPQLAPPGSGLPRPELFFARLIFAWHRRLATRTSAAALIATERDAILRPVNGLTPEAGTRRVLIRRLAGLEHSAATGRCS